MSRETKYCSSCGAEIDAKAEICPECGVKVPKEDKVESFMGELEELSFWQVLFGLLIPPYGLYLLWKALKRSR